MRWSGARGGRIRDRGHGAFRIQQMVFARAQTQFDQCSRVGDGFALPAVIGLVAAHGFFAGLVPGARGLAGQIMFADQGFLNGLGSLGIDFLLAARSHGPLPRRTFPSRSRVSLARRLF